MLAFPQAEAEAGAKTMNTFSVFVLLFIPVCLIFLFDFFVSIHLGRLLLGFC